MVFMVCVVCRSIENMRAGRKQKGSRARASVYNAIENKSEERKSFIAFCMNRTRTVFSS